MAGTQRAYICLWHNTYVQAAMAVFLYDQASREETEGMGCSGDMAVVKRSLKACAKWPCPARKATEKGRVERYASGSPRARSMACTRGTSLTGSGGLFKGDGGNQ